LLCNAVGAFIDDSVTEGKGIAINVMESSGCNKKAYGFYAVSFFSLIEKNCL